MISLQESALANTQLAVTAVFPLTGNQTGEELRQLISSGSNESVFVCSGGHLYQLSNELELLQNVSAKGCVAMSGTDDGNWLVLCFDSNSCALYPTSNLSVINSTFGNLSFYQQLNGSTVTISTALGSSPDQDCVTSFYVAAAEFENDANLRLLQRGFRGVLSRDFDSGPSKRQFIRKIQHGFHYKSNSYFLSIVRSPDNIPLLTITRVCNSDKERFSAVQEMVLWFGSGNRPVATGTSLIDSTLIVSFGGNVRTYDLMVINNLLDIHFDDCLIRQNNIVPDNMPFSGNMLSCKDIANTTTAPSLCNFTLSDESLILTRLFTPPFSIIQLEREVTSSLVITLDLAQFLFIGVVKNFLHFVEKYLLQVSTSPLYDIPVSSEVTGLIRPPGANYVYATAGNQIIRLPLETCSGSNTCTSCVTNGDPLCGWCSIERKCSRNTECMNFNDTKRYIRQGQQSNCTDSVIVDRGDFNSNHVVRLSFIPAIPPPTLSGEEYFCVFSNTEYDITFNASLSTDDFTCNLTISIPQLTEIKLVTNFSLYSNLTDTVFLTKENAFTLYNCSLGTSCSMCVETEGNCGWCLYNFTCLLQTSINASSMLTVNTSQSYVDVCPVLNPASSLLNSERHYVQPVPVFTSLVVNVTNIPAENGSIIFYQCQFGEVVVPAKMTNSSLSCDVNSEQMLFNSNAIAGKETVPLNVLLTSAGSNYILDTSTGETINVVFYKCSVLAVGCSLCLAQRLHTGFQCGWCDGSSTCMDYSENCSSAFNTMSKNCDLPIITTIHPSSGPTTGGTTLTINGSNLGVEVTDILSITVGNLTCHLNEDEYNAGRNIICDIQNSSSSQAQGNVSVVVTVRRSNDSNKMTSFQFQFKEASVISIFPSFGPAAGGTIVKLGGLNLNIGNKEIIRVFLNSDELVSCEIISISSTEICCRWKSFNTTIDVVHVSIDGTLVWNSSVTYQFLNNPVYERVLPQKTILSGGIKLNFTGQFLNASYHQRIVINNGQATGLCGLEGSTDTVLVCLAPPIPSSRSLENINYTVVMDGAAGPDLTAISLQINLVHDPSATQIINTVTVDANDTVRISGENITNVESNEIKVLVGNDTCTVQSTVSTMINCLAPLRKTPVAENVMVMFGKYLNSSAGQLNYTSPPTEQLTDAILTVSVVVPVVIVFFMILVILIVCYYYFRITNYKGELQRAQQPIYMLPELSSVAKMTENAAYQTTPFAMRDTDPHLYEELPENVTPDDEQERQAEEEFDQQLQEMLREEDQVVVNGDEEEVMNSNDGVGALIAMETDDALKVANEEDDVLDTDKEESPVVPVQELDSEFTDETDRVDDTGNSVQQQQVSTETLSGKVELKYYTHDKPLVINDYQMQLPGLVAAEDSKKGYNAEDDQLPGSVTTEANAGDGHPLAAKDLKKESNAEDDHPPDPVVAEDSKKESNAGDDQLPGLVTTEANAGDGHPLTAKDLKKESNAEDDHPPDPVAAEDSKKESNAGDDKLPGSVTTEDSSEECADYVNEEPFSREITVHLKLLFQQEINDETQ